ncbi:putative activity regulator of membrane protease YbbK [Lachnospiraceae bacterium TWA4]|nr:putative activity regulator of membrane protease YbbK [Lachnospiraceae bacterium TWA4]
MTPIYWLIFIIILIVIELATMALTTIWFAGGAVLAFFASLLGVGDIIQWMIFVIVSLILLLLTRPLALKYLKGKRTKTNVDALVGTRVLVTETIDNENATGAVSVNGQIWTAKALDNQQILHADEWVVVERVEGVKLIVKGEN